KERQRTDSARSARDTDLLYHLPVVEQSDNSFGREVACTRPSRRLCWPVAAYHRPGRLVLVWHGAGVAPAHLSAPPDDLNEPLWDNLLLAGRTSRLSRHRRSGHACDYRHPRFGGPCGRGAV